MGNRLKHTMGYLIGEYLYIKIFFFKYFFKILNFVLKLARAILLFRFRNELDINYSDEDIEVFGKVAWKKYIKEKVTDAAQNFLVSENRTKEKNETHPFH